MKRSLKIRRVYRLFDCLLGEPLGPFYRSKNDAFRALYKFNLHSKSIILGRYREFSGCFRQFEKFVKSR